MQEGGGHPLPPPDPRGPCSPIPVAAEPREDMTSVGMVGGGCPLNWERSPWAPSMLLGRLPALQSSVSTALKQDLPETGQVTKQALTETNLEQAHHKAE